MGKFFLRFIKDDDGPTAVEYAVMLALIVVACVGAIQTLGQQAQQAFTNAANSIQTGS